MKKAIASFKKQHDRDTLVSRRLLSSFTKTAHYVIAKYNGFKCRNFSDGIYARREKNDKSLKPKAFFEKLSVHLPGTRTVSKRTLELKKVLDSSLRALYKEYVEENPQDSFAFSTFCKKRPQNILSYTKTPLVQCSVSL